MEERKGGREKNREGKVGKDCAVLKLFFKKPWSWSNLYRR